MTEPWQSVTTGAPTSAGGGPEGSHRGVDRQVQSLQRTRDDLNVQVQALRAELASLQRVCQAMQAGQLLEANEERVLAALRAQDLAHTVRAELDTLARSSQRDPLTGTANRALLLDRLDAAVAMAQRHGKQVAVLFIDLDQFKAMNDGHGHAMGDRVLQWVALQLERVVRVTDTVCRDGGDEFLVLLPEITHRHDAALIGTTMLAAVGALGHGLGLQRPLSASLGIAIFPADGASATALISLADAKMYGHKRLRSRP